MYLNKIEKRIWFIGLIITIIFVILPLGIDVERSFLIYFLFITFINITLSQGWNLVAGYAGQISLGTHLFFGLGAYLTAIVWLNDFFGIGVDNYYFNPVLIILSGTIPAGFAALIGLPLLWRLRGDSFSFGTLAVAYILTIFAIKLRKITGGADGLHLPSIVYESMKPYYYVSLLIAIGSTILIYTIAKSSYGLTLRAICEDELSAICHGVPILRYKILTFAISAFLAGISGSVYGLYLFHINPDSVMNLNWLFYPILICVLGGIGTVLGPVIGSFVSTALFCIGDIYFRQLHPLFSGMLIIIIMKFLPGGILQYVKYLFIKYSKEV